MPLVLGTARMQAIRSIPNEQHVAAYQHWAQFSAGRGYFNGWLRQVLNAFSLTLAPQSSITYSSSLEFLGQLIYSYSPRLISATDFTKNWEVAELRPMLVYELMAFSFARLVSRINQYPMASSAKFQSPELLGGILQQAILAYEFGDTAARRSIEQFWYNFALGGGLPILETKTNIADFVDAGFCSKHRIPVTSLEVSPLAPLEALRGVMQRERVGVLGYLTHSNPEHSIVECVSSAISIALRWDIEDKALFR